jgi:hypothetical protein
MASEGDAGSEPESEVVGLQATPAALLLLLLLLLLGSRCGGLHQHTEK